MIHRAAAGRALLPLLLLLSTLGTAVLAGCARESSERFNVIVLVPDTFRGDRMSANGYARPITPNLDALAAEGANFRNAATVAPRTWQSFSSILTGRYPPKHGVRFIFDKPIPNDVPVIGSYLRAQGWDTAAADHIKFLNGMTGGDDFDTYINPTEKDYPGVPTDVALLKEVEEFVFRKRDRPFLVFVRLSGGHWPYVSRSFIPEGERCEDFDHSFNRGTYGLQQKPGGGMALKDPDAFKRLIWNTDEDERTRQHRIAHYDSEIHVTDRRIGKFVDELRAKGMLANTLIALTSDHGESFGEHGYLQHGPRVDEPVMHVPFFIRLPERHPDYRPGVVVDAQVRVIDLFPTVIDALGLPLPDGLDGASLMPVLRGEKLEERWGYGETGRSFMGVDPERHLLGIEGKHRMIRTDRWKLVYIPDEQGGKRQLFDLKSDPGEQKDLAAEHPDVVQELFDRMEAVRASSIEEDEDPELTEAQLERLRALGYVQ